MAEKSASNETRELRNQIKDKDERIKNLRRTIELRENKIDDLDEDNSRLRNKILKYEQVVKMYLNEDT